MEGLYYKTIFSAFVVVSIFYTKLYSSSPCSYCTSFFLLFLFIFLVLLLWFSSYVHLNLYHWCPSSGLLLFPFSRFLFLLILSSRSSSSFFCCLVFIFLVLLLWCSSYVHLNLYHWWPSSSHLLFPFSRFLFLLILSFGCCSLSISHSSSFFPLLSSWVQCFAYNK